MAKIEVFGHISTETMAQHEWVKYEDHLVEMKHAEEMYIAMRDRCARVEAEIAEKDKEIEKLTSVDVAC